jgi:biotin carboxyl carrier protein
MTSDNKENTEKRPAGDELVQFTVNGDTMYTSLTKKYINRKKWTRPDEKKIISFIPGTVKEVLVREGDSVPENGRLIVLEAMKMMNVILSPVAGTVEKIYVKPGERIPRGKIMIGLKN